MLQTLRGNGRSSDPFCSIVVKNRDHLVLLITGNSLSCYRLEMATLRILMSIRPV